MGNCVQTEPKERSRLIDRDLLQQRQERKKYNLLFFGAPKTGKSTLFNQLRITLGTGFNLQSRLSIKLTIYKHIITSMRYIVQIIEILHYEDENNLSLDDSAEEHGDKIYDFDTNDIHSDDTLDEIMSCVQILRQQKAVKHILKNSNDYFVDNSLQYFLNELPRICDATNYIPSDADIIHFWYEQEKGIREQTIVRNNNRICVMDMNYNATSNYNKFLHCFDSITALIFVVSLNCFDEIVFDEKEMTQIEKLQWKQCIQLLEDMSHRDIAKLIMEYIIEYEMVKQLQLFRKICCDPYFKHTSFILFLNKNDLFTNKIQSMDDEKNNTFLQHFPDYTGNINDVAQCGKYIQSLFEDIFDEYSYHYYMKKNQKTRSQIKEMNSHFVDATDSALVEKLFSDVGYFVINDSLRKGGLIQDEKFENGQWVPCKIWD